MQNKRPQELTVSRIQRMMSEANSRFEDGRFLDERNSDSGQLLKILAFEILLKCTVYSARGRYKRAHSYQALWDQLPRICQEEIQQHAQIHLERRGDANKIEELFADWERVFTKARYYYEFYEDKTIEEQKDAGEEWIKRGALVEEALVKYHPFELEGMIEALNDYLKTQLQKQLKRFPQRA